MGKSKKTKWVKPPSRFLQFKYGGGKLQNPTPISPLTLDGVAIVCRMRRNFWPDTFVAVPYFLQIGIDISHAEVNYVWNTLNGMDEHTKLHDTGWMGRMYTHIMTKMRDDPK